MNFPGLKPLAPSRSRPDQDVIGSPPFLDFPTFPTRSDTTRGSLLPRVFAPRPFDKPATPD